MSSIDEREDHGAEGGGAGEQLSAHESHHHAGHNSHHHAGHSSHRHVHHGPHRHHHDHEKPMTLEEAVSSLLLLGQVSLEASDYDSAVEAYASALKLEQNETALYNLGSLYARGLGVRQDYVEAARLFHQAELVGNERAGKLCGKCMLDYVGGGLEQKSPADVYAAMALFVARVYPEATEPRQEVNNGLIAIASTYLNVGANDKAAKVFHAAAEFGSDERARRYLEEL